jgi:hypothetical protein
MPVSRWKSTRRKCPRGARADRGLSRCAGPRAGVVTTYRPGRSLTTYLPVRLVLAWALIFPSRLNWRSSPLAGSSHGSPTRQTGIVGPRMTMPRRPEAVREAAAPANAEASASAADAITSARMTGFCPTSCAS